MHVQRQIDQLLDHRAAEWLEALRGGAERERRQFDQWLRQSPVHGAHLLEMAALERALQELDADRMEDVESILQRLHSRPRAPVFRPGVWNRWTSASSSQRRNSAAAALAAMLVLGLALLWTAGHGLRRANTIDTAVGEQRSVTLADGSLVTLNTASEIRIDYSATRREVRLDAGEAVFKVARDPARPFEVRTGWATIRALGTQFNVYQRPDDTLVSVLEGRVQVRASRGAPRVLESGQEARVLADGSIVPLPRADVAKTLAWRQRRLSFDAAPLEEIVREFNRYNETLQLRIEGVPRDAYHFGGIYDADDPESLAQILAREPELMVKRGPGEIVIRGREGD